MENSEIKKIIAIGIGAAVYLVLARFGSIPTPIPNTTLQITYAFLALIAFVYGPLVGTLAGFIGHTLNDITAYGSPWYSWIIATAFFGFSIGILGKIIKLEDFKKGKIIKFIIGEIIISVVTWGIVAPGLDILIYKEPSNKVFAQGIVAGTGNALVVAILGTILVYGYSRTIIKKGSLKEEK